ELRDVILDLDFRQFQDKAWEDKVPLIEKSFSMLLDLGIYEGNAFESWMRGMLARRGVRTFADLAVPGEDDPRWHSKLSVIVSDVTKHELLVLPRDAAKLGLEPDELDVARAVRMSMSIPIFFEPVRFENAKTGETHVLVDGGMLSNFPVWIFDCDDGRPPDWPTFGLLLVEPKPEEHVGERVREAAGRDRGVSAMVSYVKALAQTMMEAHDRIYVAQATYARTIPIPTLGVSTTDFELTRERKLALYDAGREAAETFLSTWDFDAYVAEFRSGKTHSRRKALVGELTAARQPVAV
ncbi:MAG TPA: patatin-like phospholipase family protein, partial [Gaiellaceae bacterium]|nr:patatin-like phospholipase family protein [Gaiellaceae bacterium]